MKTRKSILTLLLCLLLLPAAVLSGCSGGVCAGQIFRRGRRRDADLRQSGLYGYQSGAV